MDTEVTQAQSRPERMRVDLKLAMKARDGVTVRALRTTLAAFSNAEAPPADTQPTPTHGAAEHPRLVLTSEDHERILRDEVDDRHDTIDRYEDGGRAAAAEVLRQEVAVLERYLP
jgi:uncharacterized protein YqeY